MANTLMTAPPLIGPPPHVPDRISLRPIAEADLRAVGDAYARTYAGTPDAMTAEEAQADIDASWAGDYGQWQTAASLGAWIGDELAGAILTVTDAPWDDAPAGPFIIDLFVLPEHRRHGIGRALVRAAQHAVMTGVALRVDDDAVPARRLYESLSFTAGR